MYDDTVMELTETTGNIKDLKYLFWLMTDWILGNFMAIGESKAVLSL